MFNLLPRFKTWENLIKIKISRFSGVTGSSEFTGAFTAIWLEVRGWLLPSKGPALRSGPWALPVPTAFHTTRFSLLDSLVPVGNWVCGSLMIPFSFTSLQLTRLTFLVLLAWLLSSHGTQEWIQTPWGWRLHNRAPSLSQDFMAWGVCVLNMIFYLTLNVVHIFKVTTLIHISPYSQNYNFDTWKSYFTFLFSPCFQGKHVSNTEPSYGPHSSGSHGLLGVPGPDNELHSRGTGIALGVIQAGNLVPIILDSSSTAGENSCPDLFLDISWDPSS